MKKIFYLVMSLGFVLMGCDAMDDVYSELDQLPSANNQIVGDVVYKLTEDDYTLKISEGGFLELSFPNFNSVEDGKTLIPKYLTGTYPVWGVTYKDDGTIKKASSAEITFDWYNKKNTYSRNIYELSDQEHNDITGKTFGNFDRSYHIFNYLDATYPNPEEGDFYSLRYRYYEGGETELTDGFAYVDGEWERFAGFTPDEYKAMGEGFPNFSSHDEAEQKIPIALVDKFKFDPKDAGDVVGAMYELYKGGGVTKSYTTNYVFDGSTFSKYNNVANETVKFGHNGTTWVPDNTIKYALTSDDIATIVAALGAEHPNPTSNVDRFGSFDRRPGGDNYWDNDLLLKAFNVVLNANNPGAADGQKYALTIVTYVGSLVNEDFNVIKEGIEWVYN